MADLRFETRWCRTWRFLTDGAPGGSPGATPPAPPAAPTPPASPSGPTPLAGPDGTLASGWLQHDKMDPGIRTSKTLATITTVQDMARMLDSAERTIGKKRAVIPDAGDTAAADSYFELVGWPRSGPDAYPKMERPADMPKELQDDPETDKAWRSWCHKQHMTAEQFVGLTQALQAWQIADFKNGQAAAAAKQETDRAAFRTEHGAKADFRIQLGNTAAVAFMNEKELADARARGWLTDPMFLSIMARVGEAVSPDRLHANSSGGIDTGGIRRQIEDLETSEAYRKSDHPKHDAVTQQVLQLREQLRAAG